MSTSNSINKQKYDEYQVQSKKEDLSKDTISNQMQKEEYIHENEKIIRNRGRHNLRSHAESTKGSSNSNKTSSISGTMTSLKQISQLQSSKEPKNNNQGHSEDPNQDESEPALRKKIHLGFMENSFKIEEMDTEYERGAPTEVSQSNDQNKQQQQQSRRSARSIKKEEDALDQEYQSQDEQPPHMSAAYRLPRQKDSQNRRQPMNPAVFKAEPQVQYSKEQSENPSQPQAGNHANSNSRTKAAAAAAAAAASAAFAETDSIKQEFTLDNDTSETRFPNIRIQKINFGGFSDSDDGGAGDNYNQSAGGAPGASTAKTSVSKKSNKAVTLIFQRMNELQDGNDESGALKRTIEEEIDGSSQNFQSGNLMISICNSDEHYPPLFNQRYLEDNISLIQKKQCHIRQKRRQLQLEMINSISIDKDNKLYNLLDENVIKEQNQGSLQITNGIVEYEQSLRPQPVSKQKVKCNCKKTKCLKLYCDCFNQGEFCSEDCNCSECSNTEKHKDERDQVMAALKERNPVAFKPKLQTKDDDEEVLVHNKGCNCKKSGCEKKYCECYNTGVKCSSHCKCEGCRNRDPQQLVNNKSNGGASNQNMITNLNSNSFNAVNNNNNNNNNNLMMSALMNQNSSKMMFHTDQESGEYIHENSNHNMLSNGSNYHGHHHNIHGSGMHHHHNHHSNHHHLDNMHSNQKGGAVGLHDESGIQMYLNNNNNNNNNNTSNNNSKGFSIGEFNSDIQGRLKKSGSSSGMQNFSSFNDEKNKLKMKQAASFQSSAMDSELMYQPQEDFPNGFPDIGSLGILGQQQLQQSAGIQTSNSKRLSSESMFRGEKSSKKSSGDGAANPQKNDETVLSLKNGLIKNISKTK